ncbi:MAG: hypothetical protein GF308_21885 [Candidatus Heimdallarchaeota archaeon]|nr:hypothetical protein [Candidatus Heimdallarchaeota archaeon]
MTKRREEMMAAMAAFEEEFAELDKISDELCEMPDYLLDNQEEATLDNPREEPVLDDAQLSEKLDDIREQLQTEYREVLRVCPYCGHRFTEDELVTGLAVMDGILPENAIDWDDELIINHNLKDDSYEPKYFTHWYCLEDYYFHSITG